MNRQELEWANKLKTRKGGLRSTKPKITFRNYIVDGEEYSYPIDGEVAYLWRRLVHKIGNLESHRREPRDMESYLGEPNDEKRQELMGRLDRLAEELMESGFFGERSWE